MTTTAPQAPTTGQIASELRTSRDRVQRAIKRLGLQPEMVAGPAPIYSRDSVEAIRREIGRIDRGEPAQELAHV